MVTDARYLLKWCPIDDSLLKDTNWIDCASNSNSDIVENFVETIARLNDIDNDKLQTQFLDYHTPANQDLQRLYSMLSPPLQLEIVQ